MRVARDDAGDRLLSRDYAWDVEKIKEMSLQKLLLEKLDEVRRESRGGASERTGRALMVRRANSIDGSNARLGRSIGGATPATERYGA
jgi:hypothetical protein